MVLDLVLSLYARWVHSPCPAAHTQPLHFKLEDTEKWQPGNPASQRWDTRLRPLLIFSCGLRNVLFPFSHPGSSLEVYFVCLLILKIITTAITQTNWLHQSTSFWSPKELCCGQALWGEAWSLHWKLLRSEAHSEPNWHSDLGSGCSSICLFWFPAGACKCPGEQDQQCLRWAHLPLRTHRGTPFSAFFLGQVFSPSKHSFSITSHNTPLMQMRHDL